MAVKPITLTLGHGSFGTLEAEMLFQHLAQLTANDRRTILCLDMSGINFIRPFGVLAIVTAAQTWQKWRQASTQLVNVQPEVHAYLERIDLFQQCSEFILEDQMLAADQRYSRVQESRSLLEITPISSDRDANERDVHQVIQRTRQILESRYGSNKSSALLLSLVSELATNIFHSHDQGFIMAQSYSDQSSAGSRVLIAISDAGIGIEASLRSNVTLQKQKATRLKNGSDYILFALEEGVSSLATKRGLGLHYIRQMVEKWKGSLVIRSSSSKVEIPLNQPPVAYDGLPQIPGTQVTITVQGMWDDKQI